MEEILMSRYDHLKLKKQICFPLYAASREIIKRYRPYLDELNLTYTQYLAMLVCWEEKTISVKEMGIKLFLDFGTLTPVLKSLESKGYVRRARSSQDERVVMVELTPEGEALKKKAVRIPDEMMKQVCLDQEEIQTLRKLIYRLLEMPEE